MNGSQQEDTMDVAAMHQQTIYTRLEKKGQGTQEKQL
jgi:hypothetical protein